MIPPLVTRTQEQFKPFPLSHHNFSSNNVSSWLTIVRSQFELAAINRPETKFHHIVSAIPPEIFGKVLEGASVEKPNAASYNTLIEAIKNRCVPPKSTRLHALLDTEEMNEKTPSSICSSLPR